MERAVYSKNRQLISVGQYGLLEGPKLNHLGLKASRALVTCPACAEPCHTVGENIPNRANVWGHDPNPNGPWCPIKSEGGERYEILTPTHPDHAAGAALKESFLRNWQIHWGFIIGLAPFADIFQFINFIKGASTQQFWSHVDLEEWHIAYIFLATCDFPPSAARTEWLRFMFDNKVRTFEQLWIRTENDWTFLKMRYRKPRSGRPGPSHYIDCDIYTPDPAYPTKPQRAPNTFQINAMKVAFGV
jgi:hypothetical protein